MSEERLRIDDETSMVNAMEAAEHFVRYASLAPIVEGRRVLDIACGEGYGSWLLKKWGASSVVGVDISAEAVATAKQYFSSDGIQYLVADACHISEKLPVAGFDLIASFETIEHVFDAEQFLIGLRTLAAPGAQIFVSCPNDHVSCSPDQSNPYHLRKYTFEEFKNCCENVLGSASQWLLGANVQGYALVSEAEPLISENSWSRADTMTKSHNLVDAFLMPSQQNIHPDRANAFYYMGIWGGKLTRTPMAVSAQSYLAFKEPWEALDWFKAERVQMQNELKFTTEHLADSRRQIIALQGVVTKIGNESRSAVAENAQLRASYNLIINSRSWRLTRVFRGMARLMRGQWKWLVEKK